MKYLVQPPFDAIRDHQNWCGGRHIRDWAIAVERAGFDGLAVTDHPFPSDPWLATGGHHSFDPFVFLAVLGEATTTLRLVTDVIVAGYRNPYMAAKSIASLDVLSSGRLIVGMAAGYQQEEFEAIGAVYDRRGHRFDAAIEAITAALTGKTVRNGGEFYPAAGNTMLPRPVQLPRPPLWIGGNSDVALDRAVRLADGWMPFAQPAARVPISGSPALESLTALADRIGEANQRRSEVSNVPLEICASMFSPPRDADELAAQVGSYEDAGVNWLRVPVGGDSMDNSIARATALGAALSRRSN